MKQKWDKNKTFDFARWISINRWIYHPGFSRWVDSNLETMLTNDDLLNRYLTEKKLI